MLFKKIIILLLFFSMLVSQTYVNAIVGHRIKNIAPKSIAMGGFGIMDNNSVFAGRINPANIMNSKGLGLSILFNTLQNNEYRSFPSIDGFENTFSDVTYVANSNYYNSYNLGLVYQRGRLGISISTGPLLSTNYNYIEEVRNSDDSLDGFFQLKTSGVVRCNSYGIAASIGKLMNIGISINQLLGTNFEVYLNDNDSILTYSSNLNPIRSFGIISLAILPTDNINFAMSYEENAKLEYSNRSLISMDDSMNLPVLEIGNDEQLNKIHKPDALRFGLLFSPKGIYSHSLSVEYEYYYYSNFMIDNVKLNDSYNIGIGVEYLLYDFLPLRLGLSQRTSEYRDDLSQINFAFGTGWSYGNYLIDVSLQYWNSRYPYVDLFPVPNDLSNPFPMEMVEETNLDFSISFQYKF